MTSPTPPRWPNPGPDGRLKEKHLPAHLGQTNLNATYAPVGDYVTPTDIDPLVADAIEAALGEAQDVPVFTEDWADLVGWSTSGLSVSGGKLLPAASSSGANHPVTYPSGNWRITSTITLVKEATGKYTLVGLSAGTPGGAYAGATTFAIGFRSDGIPMAYRGSSLGGAGFMPALSGTACADGDYAVRIEADDTTITATLIRVSAPSEQYIATIPRNAGAFVNVTVNSNGGAGNRIGPISIVEPGQSSGIGATLTDLDTRVTTAERIGSTTQRMAVVGSSDRAAALADARAAWEDASTLVENWSNLTSWTASNLTVSGGKLVGAASGNGAVRAIVPGSGRFRFRTSIEITVGASGSYTMVGFSESATWDATKSLNIGFRSDGVPFAYHGSAVGGGAGWVSLGSAQASGTYYVTGVLDDHAISLTLTNASGSLMWRYRIPRTTMPSIISVAVQNSSTTNLLGPIGARGAVVSVNPRSGFEDLAYSEIWTLDANGQDLRVILPKTFDSRRPMPVVINAHGNGGTAMSGTSTPGRLALVQGLLDAGFIYASHFMHDRNWGSQAAVDDLTITYRYLRSRFPIGPVCLYAESMGTLSSLTAIAKAAFPVAGVGIIDGVSNLAWNWANGSGSGTPDSDLIKAAYGLASDGSDYAAKTAGHDPMLRSAAEFRGVPVQMTSSTGDTRIPPAYHADLLAAKLQGHTELTVLTHTGGHTDDSAYAVADWVPFFTKCVTA